MSAHDYETYRPPAHPLPEEPVHATRPARRQHRPVGFCGGGDARHQWVKITMICVAIWAFTGFGHFWPMWVMLGLGIPVLFGRR